MPKLSFFCPIWIRIKRDGRTKKKRLFFYTSTGIITDTENI